MGRPRKLLRCGHAASARIPGCPGCIAHRVRHRPTLDNPPHTPNGAGRSPAEAARARRLVDNLKQLSWDQLVGWCEARLALELGAGIDVRPGGVETFLAHGRHSSYWPPDPEAQAA
jgi:hypothetical protein